METRNCPRCGLQLLPEEFATENGCRDCEEWDEVPTFDPNDPDEWPSD